jgi:hypothetical protein
MVFKMDTISLKSKINSIGFLNVEVHMNFKIQILHKAIPVTGREGP